MDVQKFIEAGEKLGLVDAELQAWAEQQARCAREERAQAQEFESRRIESERHNRELEREVLVRKLRLEELQTRRLVLGRADENEVRTEAPNQKLTSAHKDITIFTGVKLSTNADIRRQVSSHDVQCDQRVKRTEGVLDYPETHRIENAKDFLRPEMLNNEHNIPNSKLSLEKERTERQSQDLGNSQGFLCPKVLNNEQGSSSSCFLFDEAITTVSLTKEYDTSMEATKVHYVIGTERIIKEDLIGFNTSPITSTEQPECSEVERIAGLSACCLDSQPSKNASQVSLTSDIAYVHLCRAPPLMKTWRENKFKDRLHSRQQYKTRPKAWKFAQCKWNAYLRWQGVHYRRSFNTQASQDEPIWCRVAHRKFVRFKKSACFLWQDVLAAAHIERVHIVPIVCQSRNSFVSEACVSLPLIVL